MARQGREAKHRAPGGEVGGRSRRRSAFFFFSSCLGRRRCCRGKGEERGLALFLLSLLFRVLCFSSAVAAAAAGRQGLEDEEGFGRRRRREISFLVAAEAAAAAAFVVVVRFVLVLVGAPLFVFFVHRTHNALREVEDPLRGRRKGRGREIFLYVVALLFLLFFLGQPKEQERVLEPQENGLPRPSFPVLAPCFLLLLAFRGGLVEEILLSSRFLLECPAGEIGRVEEAGLRVDGEEKKRGRAPKWVVSGQRWARKFPFLLALSLPLRLFSLRIFNAPRASFKVEKRTRTRQEREEAEIERGDRGEKKEVCLFSSLRHLATSLVLCLHIVFSSPSH